MSACAEPECDSLPGAPLSDYFGVKPIWTPEIGRKAALVAEWVACDMPGAHIWGLQHSGKTEFTKYLVDVLPSMVGGNLTGYIWDFAGYKVHTVDELLKRCLISSGCNAVATRSRSALQTRLVDLVVRRCQDVQARRALLIIDEIQNVPHGLYDAFMSVHSDLMRAGILPHVLSIGQPEMEQSISLIYENKMLQHIGRFFPTTAVYKALTLEDVQELLQNMDGTVRTFSTTHYPERAEQGWSVADLIVPIGQALDAITQAQSLTARPRLPLRYLRPALNLMFRFMAGRNEAIVDRDIALQCFESVGLPKIIAHYVDRHQTDA